MRATQRILHTESHTKVTIRRVASEAGVGVGTVTYYFADRASLLEACLDSYYEGLEALVGPLLLRLAQTRDARGTIVEGVERLVRFAFENRAAIRLRLLSNVEAGELAPVRRSHFARPLIGKLAVVASKLVGLDASEVRLTTYSLNYAVTRYAAMTDEELCEMTGAPDVAAACEMITRHIVRMTQRAMS